MVKTPVEPPQARRRLRFGDPIQHESPIPRLCDTPRWERERVYWQAHEYAQIRDNQRRLIETVLRSARQCGEGELPPPIPGESRRGLGLICEPGTNSGRAARVRSARRAVVEAQRDGYSPAQLADLAAETPEVKVADGLGVLQAHFSGVVRRPGAQFLGQVRELRGRVAVALRFDDGAPR